ncbi:MAG: class I SAM-dependent methyltransferase [Nitrososphaeraceae archaeon]
MSTLDSKQYKEAERQKWDNVANGWKKWWNTTERGAGKLSKRLMELAEIKPGSRVLDIATGIGEPAITAANKIGKTGHILATDISPGMLSVAKQRAISLGLQNVIEFKEGDIETIDLPPSTFDTALCRGGLMFLPDLKAGLSNIYRSLIEGGRFAAAVWASPDKVPFISEVMNTITKETNSQPPPPGTPGPFSLSDENSLKNSFITSGFKDPIIEKMNVSLDFESADDFTTFVLETAGPVQTILANQTSERRGVILGAITEVAKKYAHSTGRVKFDNEAILIVGKK